MTLGAGWSMAGEPLSFTYEKGKPTAETPIRTHEMTILPLDGEVFIYCSFNALETNPAALVGGQPKGLQTVAVGSLASGEFVPAVRFGMAKDTHQGHGEHSSLVPWLSDGRLDYYGMYARPKTTYDFKIRLGLQQKVMTVWVSGRGDDDWFLLAENAPLAGEVSAINHVRVEQYPGSQGIGDLVLQSKASAEREAVRPHPRAKKDRVVGPDRGFKFQSMRSACWKAGRHVRIARDPTRWLGFPDVVQTGPHSLACTHNDGQGHGGGGGMFVRHSHDMGRTWGQPIRVHPSGINCPRIQKLGDGTLLLAGGLHGTDTVLYDSVDGGVSWVNQRWCRPKETGPGAHRITVPSRVTELPDGSWLIAGAWYPGMNAWKGTDGCRLELFRSTDRGKTWKFHAYLADYPPHSICEASVLVLDDGRLLLYARETRHDGFPGIKAYSSDLGKTWQVKELPFPVVGRTCAGFLKDGRVMLTTREGVGQNGLWAWVGDPLDETPFRALGVHFNDAHSVGLKDGCLHVDSDGQCGQFTQYHLRPPDSAETSIDVTVEVKVVANQGRAATLSVPFAGRLQIFPDRVEVAHDRSLRVEVAPDRFHTYRVVRRGENIKAWTPYSRSIYALAFGNDDGAVVSSPNVPLRQINADVTGYSIWRRAEAAWDDPKTGKRVTSWSAAPDGFPDQYLLDHMIEVDASVSGGDQGYSGWIELADGRIFVVNYTDDHAPRWRMEGSVTIGGSWIRGTWLLPSDLPSESRSDHMKALP